MPFWSNSPAAWFRAAEAQFAIRGNAGALDRYWGVAAVKGGNRKGKSGRGGKKNNKQRSHSPSDEKKSPLCWLHIRFGDKARRCEQPCAWPSAEN
jgi:hypothetical protein